MKKVGLGENILVVGGAGYIGAHMCKLLAAKGFVPVVLDNLSTGHRNAVKWGPLVEGNMGDPVVLDRIFSDYAIAAVMHFAAFINVGDSVEQPLAYYHNNVGQTLVLLRTMLARGITRLIFSSTAAVYGDPLTSPITESHSKNPINPYGQGKLMVEQILEDLRRAHGFESIAFRYFNAAGADPDGEIGEDHHPETHLIPNILNAVLQKQGRLSVFGDDYDTPDGTCIRDYIHVADLVSVHFTGLDRLLAGKPGGCYNLGNGKGYSVKEVLDTAGSVTGCHIPVRIGPRRAGDSAQLVSSSKLAMRELDWKPQYADIRAIVETAWNWHKNNPEGFGD
jgi:UDP-glucose-4-epimerase GalE